jgi:hypothetical protein
MPSTILILAALAQAAAMSDGHAIQNSRLHFLFGSSSTGYTTADADRIDNITWIDSAGKTISNYIIQAEPACGDPLEFFGQTFGNPPAFLGEPVGISGDTFPHAIVRGTMSTWMGDGASTATTAVTSWTACSAPLHAVTNSSYTLSDSPDLVNALKITRSFTFMAAAPLGDFRPYVARVPLAGYPGIVYPDSAGAVRTVMAKACGAHCVITDWNGKWMAEDSGAGQGIAIFRQPNAAFPAEITIDWDADSASNASAITLIQPASGWGGRTLNETHYVCFYDRTSWPAARRAAGVPPVGCEGVPH